MLAHPIRDGALRSFCARAKLASNSSTALAGNREAAGEMVIGVHGVRSLPARIGLFLGLILTLGRVWGRGRRRDDRDAAGDSSGEHPGSHGDRDDRRDRAGGDPERRAFLAQHRPSRPA